VDVDADGVEVRGRASLGELVSDLRSRRSDDAAAPRKSRLRMRALHVTNIDARLAIPELAGTPLVPDEPVPELLLAPPSPAAGAGSLLHATKRTMDPVESIKAPRSERRILRRA
jgi:hypothetical protein